VRNKSRSSPHASPAWPISSRRFSSSLLMPTTRCVYQGRIQKTVLGGAHWTWVAEDDEARRQRRWGGIGLPSWLGVWGCIVSSPPAGSGEEPRLLMIFGHYIRNIMRSHACLSAFWNVTGKANKTDPIRQLLPAIGLEGALPPVGHCLLCPPPSGSAHGVYNSNAMTLRVHFNLVVM